MIVVDLPPLGRLACQVSAVVLGQVVAKNHKELLPGLRLANAANPQHEDREVGIFQGQPPTRVIGYQFAHLHETELVLGLLLGRHGVPELPFLLLGVQGLLQLDQLLDQGLEELLVGGFLDPVAGDQLRGLDLFLVGRPDDLVEGVVGLDTLPLALVGQNEVVPAAGLLVLLAQLAQVGVDGVLVLVLLHLQHPVLGLQLVGPGLDGQGLLFLLLVVLHLEVVLVVGLLGVGLGAGFADDLGWFFLDFDGGRLLVALVAHVFKLGINIIFGPMFKLYHFLRVCPFQLSISFKTHSLYCYSIQMADKKPTNKKVTIELTPIQLVWLHSQHQFQRIEEQALKLGQDIKFYKNNTGVELRYQRQPEDKTYDALAKARDQLVTIVEENQLKLMQTSLDKDLYVRISRQARKEFPRSYIIFLHYETFENCCRKLKEKFSITSITVELEKLRKENPYFCFLVAEKNKIQQIEKFTDRLLRSQVSCASTTFSQKQRDRTEESLPNYRRTMSVSSLKGSYASFNSERQRNELEHCRISLQPSETEEQMFEVSEVTLVNLAPAELDKVNKRKIFIGTKVHVQSFEGNYLTMKKKLYYANRLQQCSNPQLQPVYAYSMVEGLGNKWRLSLVTDKHYTPLSEYWDSVWLHSFKSKIQIFVSIAKALTFLHSNRETYGNLRDTNVLFNSQRQLFLSGIIDKNIPPHTNPYDYDIRQFLLLIYKAFTQVELSYDCLVRKMEEESYFCTLFHRCRNKLLKEFMGLADHLFIQDITLEEFAKDAQALLKRI